MPTSWKMELIIESVKCSTEQEERLEAVGRRFGTSLLLSLGSLGFNLEARAIIIVRGRNHCMNYMS